MTSLEDLTMRTIVIIVALAGTLAGASLVPAVASQSSGYERSALSRMAPADEYFGRQKESVLEIRNRLDAFDRRSDDEMLVPGTRHALDDLQDAVRDWQRKYPNDPWLPGMLRRLANQYQRCGGEDTDSTAVTNPR